MQEALSLAVADVDRIRRAQQEGDMATVTRLANSLTEGLLIWTQLAEVLHRGFAPQRPPEPFAGLVDQIGQMSSQGREVLAQPEGISRARGSFMALALAEVTKPGKT